MRSKQAPPRSDVGASTVAIVKSKPKKALTKFEKEVQKYAALFTGDTNILFVDPSSGSHGSMPGYCVIQAGRLKDVGTIEVKPGVSLNKRLHRIVSSLRQDFPRVDLLVTEFIPAFIMHQGYTSSIVNLHRGVGAILGGVECEAHVEVPAQTWHRFTPPGYVKSDAKDSLMLAIACYRVLEILRGEPVLPELVASLYAAISKLG